LTLDYTPKKAIFKTDFKKENPPENITFKAGLMVYSLNFKFDNFNSKIGSRRERASKKRQTASRWLSVFCVATTPTPIFIYRK
jgi:hypothetical protein